MMKKMPAVQPLSGAPTAIKWIGTHRDYDRIDVTEVEHDR